MPDVVLSHRALNRATLARQLLLQRAPFTAVNAVEWLGGLGAATSVRPYVSLWSRLEKFAQEDLSFAIEERRVVRATLMRADTHLVTATDYRLWRRALQPVLEQSYNRDCWSLAERCDLPAILRLAEDLLEEEPRTMERLATGLAALEPGDGASMPCMLNAARTFLSLVQVPPAGLWRVDEVEAFALADSWLGLSLTSAAEGLRHLVVRYLGAFGPASCADLEQWSGLRDMKPVLDELLPALETFRDEQDTILYDLPNGPHPDEDSPAPVRLLPAGDTLLSAYAEPERVVADEYTESATRGSNGPDDVAADPVRHRPVILIDGFARGTWSERSGPGGTTVVLQPLERLTGPTLDEVVAEAEKLALFLNEGATHQVDVSY
jgi:hypothetical protein